MGHWSWIWGKFRKKFISLLIISNILQQYLLHLSIVPPLPFKVSAFLLRPPIHPQTCWYNTQRLPNVLKTKRHANDLNDYKLGSEGSLGPLKVTLPAIWSDKDETWDEIYRTDPCHDKVKIFQRILLQHKVDFFLKSSGRYRVTTSHVFLSI